MRVCVLSPTPGPTDPPEPLATPQWVAPEHEWSLTLIHKDTVAEQLRALAVEGWDVFVNLCDGAVDEDVRPGVDVVRELERLGAAFTGAGSAFYEPSRAEMKRACEAAGIATPAHVFVTRASDAPAVARTLRFPLFVKHHSSYSSVGLTRGSICRTEEELARQIDRTACAFGGALVEEYIAGREFTVLVAEPGEGERRPRVWRPVEFHFPPGEEFKHFELKWHAYEGMTATAVEDERLAQQLMAQAADFFEALGGSGYGRCDVRMDAEGRLYMLEINPNCGIFYPPSAFGSADFILERSPGGHRAFLDHILRLALAPPRKRLPGLGAAAL